MKKAKSTLVGKFFHSFDPLSGSVVWQGEILDRIGDGYLVQLFEWICGTPSTQTIVAADDMVGWHFYESSEAMCAAYEEHQARYARDVAKR